MVSNSQPNRKGRSTLSLLAEPSLRNGFVSILPHEITTSGYLVKEVRTNENGRLRRGAHLFGTALCTYRPMLFLYLLLFFSGSWRKTTMLHFVGVSSKYCGLLGHV